MEHMMSRKMILDIIQGLIFLALAVIPIIVPSINEIHPAVRIAVVVMCIIGYGVIAWFKIIKNKEDNTEEFTEGSEAYFDFFYKWYKKHGKLSIFCSDLDWMKKEQYNIIDIICEKHENCTVYLRGDVDPEKRRKLEAERVRISPNHALLTKHRFSLLENEDASSLIITDRKGGNEDKVVIKKEDNKSNPYIITVVKDLLDSMDESERRRE
jgi:hypothetical protein